MVNDIKQDGRSDMLRSEINNETTRKMVLSAAAKKFGRGKALAWYEHGQWFVVVESRYEDEQDMIFSVVDCEDAIGNDYLDFEQIGGGI
jgi:hypothetical protein